MFIVILQQDGINVCFDSRKPFIGTFKEATALHERLSRENPGHVYKIFNAVEHAPAKGVKNAKRKVVQ